jgi:hypothetical protein
MFIPPHYPDSELAMDKAWMDTATERIDRLERDNRRLIGIVVVTLVGALLLVVEGSGLIRARKTIEGESFVLGDKAGKVRAQLGLKRDGSPQLAFYDLQGRDLVTIETQNNDLAQLTLYSKGERRANLLSAEDGTSYLKFVNREGDEISTLFLYPDDSTGLVFNNGSHAVRMALQADGTWKQCDKELTDEECSAFPSKAVGALRLAP